MNILIAGDSWGCGEWQRSELNFEEFKNFHATKVIHGGLAQYLTAAGHTVTNISKSGASNTYIAQAIRSHLERQPFNLVEQTFDAVFVFQTDYTRDQSYQFEKDWGNLEHADSLADIWVSRFYSTLSSIAQNHNCKIYLIGGCSDTLWLENMEQHYSGVNIVCQSMTNLIVSNTHRIEQPLLSWYVLNSLELVKRLKQQLPTDQLDNLMNQLDRGLERQNLLAFHPEYFFPDGVHPNRTGHEILYNFLKSTGVLNG